MTDEAAVAAEKDSSGGLHGMTLPSPPQAWLIAGLHVAWKHCTHDHATTMPLTTVTPGSEHEQGW